MKRVGICLLILIISSSFVYAEGINVSSYQFGLGTVFEYEYDGMVYNNLRLNKLVDAVDADYDLTQLDPRIAETGRKIKTRTTLTYTLTGVIIASGVAMIASTNNPGSPLFIISTLAFAASSIGVFIPMITLDPLARQFSIQFNRELGLE